MNHHSQFYEQLQRIFLAFVMHWLLLLLIILYLMKALQYYKLLLDVKAGKGYGSGYYTK